MNIAVCVKVVDGELNPFDACAVETALEIGGSITVVSMCPKSAKDVLLPLTRLGVNNVILISDPAFAGSDTLATAYILEKAISQLKADLVICGRQTIDGDTAQVGPCLATKLNFSMITNVLKITDTNGAVSAITRMGEETANYPALITVERINNLRFPSIRSKMGEVEIWDNKKLGADIKRCGLSGSPTRVLKVFENKKDFRKCKFIGMDEYTELIDELLNKDKKITATQDCEHKLKEIWAIGSEVSSAAYAISEKVKFFDKISPYEIAQLAKSETPEVILWNADLWGRRNAPVVAALLETGLCADCTALETNGEKLIMTRPARSGNVTAKIECLTKPQMATVRTASESQNLIFSLGKGAAEQVEIMKKYCGKTGAQLCASRGLVDMNIAAYEMQVGLTGKNVSPKVYVAIGISGAVHHIAGISGADSVIAVNNDKNADIFKYADYGIVMDSGEFASKLLV